MHQWFLQDIKRGSKASPKQTCFVSKGDLQQYSWPTIASAIFELLQEGKEETGFENRRDKPSIRR
jgi:hypothetical protein